MLFRFAQPYFLVLLLALLPVFFWYVRTRRNNEPRLVFSTLAVAGRLRPSLRQLLRPSLDVIRGLTLALLVVSLAQPSISRAAEVTPGEGIDIVLALDESLSMSDRDLGPKNRLDTAKDVIREFMSNRKNDRVGLVAFASEAVTVSPLTTDYPLLLQLLDGVSFGRLPEGTAIGQGLATAVNVLRDSRAKSRVIILLTDGQNNAGDISPADAAHMAELLRIRTYTVGVGAATPPPPPQRGPRSAPSGSGSSPSIDEQTLRQISETTGGSYFRAVDQTTLKQIYELIGRLEKTESGEQRYVNILDLSGYLLLAAIAFLSLETALRTTWFRRVP